MRRIKNKLKRLQPLRPVPVNKFVVGMSASGIRPLWEGQQQLKRLGVCGSTRSRGTCADMGLVIGKAVSGFSQSFVLLGTEVAAQGCRRLSLVVAPHVIVDGEPCHRSCSCSPKSTAVNLITTSGTAPRRPDELYLSIDPVMST